MLIGGTAKVLAKIFTRKELNDDLFVEIEDEQGRGIDYLVDALLAEGRINEAENVLFDEFQRAPSEALYQTGLAMYQRLNALSDERLDEGDFPRAEVEQGLRDLNELKDKLLDE